MGEKKKGKKEKKHERNSKAETLNLLLSYESRKDSALSTLVAQTCQGRRTKAWCSVYILDTCMVNFMG
jgi:hypothetical protein